MLYATTSLYTFVNRRLSLNIMEYLEEKALLTAEKYGSSLDAKRLLVFAIMGWQSMVYQPAFNICFPSELAFHHDTDAPDSGLVFNMYRAPVDMCDRSAISCSSTLRTFSPPALARLALSPPNRARTPRPGLPRIRGS
ncbi:hypothetical protein V8F33_003379 [Rhypophila sp. PSN 637]